MIPGFHPTGTSRYYRIQGQEAGFHQRSGDPVRCAGSKILHTMLDDNADWTRAQLPSLSATNSIFGKYRNCSQEISTLKIVNFKVK